MSHTHIRMHARDEVAAAAAPQPNPKDRHKGAGAPLRPNIDTNGIHRDLAGYYRAYGMFDASTADGLFESVVWPNVIAVRRPRGGGGATAATGGVRSPQEQPSVEQGQNHESCPVDYA